MVVCVFRRMQKLKYFITVFYADELFMKGGIKTVVEYISVSCSPVKTQSYISLYYILIAHMPYAHMYCPVLPRHSPARVYGVCIVCMLMYHH